MDDISKLAIIIVETQRDKALIPTLLTNIRASIFNQHPTFVVVSGEGKQSSLSVALNSAIKQAAEVGCEYVFWAHPDMEFRQLNWYVPLVHILETKNTVIKVCASNSRDEPRPCIQLDQEQAWMMRVQDYLDNDWLWFNESFQMIGGFEDWFQSWSIISRGKLVLVTPESQVFHAGMGTRKLRNTVEEQRHNSGIYTSLAGIDENPHQWKFFGRSLTSRQKVSAFRRVCKEFPEFCKFESKLDTYVTRNK